MSEIEKKEISSMKGKGVIQYASDSINALDDNDPMKGIKEMVRVSKIVQEAIQARKKDEEEINYNDTTRTPIVTGTEIKKDLEEGLYR